jgi:alpha-glucoside transport system permease protein
MRRAAVFFGPALLVLLTLVAYPIVNTIWLSLHNADGSKFVGLDNYISMFTAPETRRAILNNAIWVLVAPSVVTAVGLVCAVLTEKVKLGTAFKAVLFMPMAISFLAAGVTFRLVYDENPDRGVLNAMTVAVHDSFAPPSLYYGATTRYATTVSGRTPGHDPHAGAARRPGSRGRGARRVARGSRHQWRGVA